eukprot:1959735-Rhodomonas_salina.2
MRGFDACSAAGLALGASHWSTADAVCILELHRSARVDSAGSVATSSVFCGIPTRSIASLSLSIPPAGRSAVLYANPLKLCRD